MLIYIFTKDIVGNTTALQVYNRSTADYLAKGYLANEQYKQIWIDTIDTTGHLRYTVK